MESGGGDGCQRPDSTTTEWEDEDSQVEDYYYDDESERGDAGTCRAAVVRGSKHRDGSIYRQDTHWIHRLYHTSTNTTHQRE